MAGVSDTDRAELWKHDDGDCILGFKGSDTDFLGGSGKNGVVGFDDWINNLAFVPAQYRGLQDVHWGFVNELEPLFLQIENTSQPKLSAICSRKFVVTGHSLGGALASMFAAIVNMESCTCDVDVEVDYLYTFGAPALSEKALINRKRADGCFPGARFRTGSRCLSLDGSIVYDGVTTVPPWFEHPMLPTVDVLGKSARDDDSRPFGSSSEIITPCGDYAPVGVTIVESLRMALDRASQLSEAGATVLKGEDVVDFVTGAKTFGTAEYQLHSALTLAKGQLDLHQMTTYNGKFQGALSQECRNNACAKCQGWYGDEMQDTAWLDNVNNQIKCPCTVRFVGHEMLHDDATGEWQVDLSCSPTWQSWAMTNVVPEYLYGGGCARFHPGAYGCMRSEPVIDVRLARQSVLMRKADP